MKCAVHISVLLFHDICRPSEILIKASGKFILFVKFVTAISILYFNEIIEILKPQILCCVGDCTIWAVRPVFGMSHAKTSG